MKFLFVLAAVLAGSTLVPSARAESLEVYLLKEEMIRESIANYEGACACPYSVKSNGNLCGDSSAWSKPGGADPLCYHYEISIGMLNYYILYGEVSR